MAGTSFTTIGRNPEILVTAINTQFNNEKSKFPTVYQKIALVDTSTPGPLAKYPMRVTSSGESAAEPMETRKISTAELIMLECYVKEYRSPIEMVPAADFYDPYSVLEGRSKQLVRQAYKIPDRVLATAINENGFSFESKNGVNYNFFGTHPVNPAFPSYSTYTNDINAPVSEAGFLAAYDQMQTLKGFDNQDMNQDMEKLIVLVDNIKDYIKFAKYFNEGLVATQIPGGAASENTRLVGMAEIILMPELRSKTAPGKYWYLINVSDMTSFPLILRQTQQPNFKFIAKGDYLDHERGAMGMYYDTFIGAGYGLPQRMIRCQAV